MEGLTPVLDYQIPGWFCIEHGLPVIRCRLPNLTDRHQHSHLSIDALLQRTSGL